MGATAWAKSIFRNKSLAPRWPVSNSCSAITVPGNAGWHSNTCTESRIKPVVEKHLAGQQGVSWGLERCAPRHPSPAGRGQRIRLEDDPLLRGLFKCVHVLRRGRRSPPLQFIWRLSAENTQHRAAMVKKGPPRPVLPKGPRHLQDLEPQHESSFQRCSGPGRLVLWAPAIYWGFQAD